jgi:CDP-glycerol glycerophosphotransferase
MLGIHLGIRDKIRYLQVVRKGKKIRKKSVIRVAFVISEAGVWKTEFLYKAMLLHPRFDPILLAVTSKEIKNDTKPEVINMFKSKGYEYIDFPNDRRIVDEIHPDIIFYQKPYYGSYYEPHMFYNNMESLFCWVKYGFHLIHQKYTYNMGFQPCSWQLYYENDICYNAAKQMMVNKARNCYVTGVPMSDELIAAYQTVTNDPWDCSDKKKRIIWAPHHTVTGNPGPNVKVDYSTFLDYCDFMIEMAYKYRNEIHIAFKPHPLLRNKLLKLGWSVEKIDEYYDQWKNLANGQYVTGKYTDLFMTSDAMIHDCGSFTLEYHYTKNPVLFLVKGKNHGDDLNPFGKQAFDLHYKGYCKEDIEQFIVNVIHGNDEMKQLREDFYKNELIPPHGKTACENIINCILGIEEYQ